MKKNYIIRFENHGELSTPSGLLDNEIWLDVGNQLAMGYFDHHQVQGYDSSLMALLQNPQYLERLLESAKTQDTIIVHVHKKPDLDCVACFFAVRYILEQGKEAFEQLFLHSEVGKKLIAYVNDIDAGRKKETRYPTLYAIYCAIDSVQREEKQLDQRMLDCGVELLEFAVQELEQDSTLDLATCNFEKKLADRYSKEIELIHQMAYETGKKDSTIAVEQISVWTKDKKQAAVPAAIWTDLPKNYYGYDYARKDGAVLTIVPYAIRRRHGAETTRVFASINPDIDTEMQYTLKPIAEILEQMEQIEEERLYEQTGVYRRDHSRPRRNDGILGKTPFSVTSDPWYVKPEEDLFDAPRELSLLEYSDILEVIRHNGSAVKTSYVLEVKEKEEPMVVYKASGYPLCEWQDEIEALTKTTTSHLIIYGELDASLIRHSNKILEAYCMNVLGRSLYDAREANFLYLDYRTCICSELNYTIILSATYGEEEKKYLPLYEILHDATEDTIKSSPLIRDIVRICNQRMGLLSFGTKIGELRFRKRKEIENLNEKLLAFSARTQKEDMIDRAVEQKVYAFIKDEFDIAELKASIMEEMNILTSESRERLVSKFNVLSAFAVPFVLIATIFDMGLFQFDELLSLSGTEAKIGWCVMIALIIVMMVVIMFAGTKREDDKK